MPCNHDRIKVHKNSLRKIFTSIHSIKSKSVNRKTGDMVGVYILPSDKSPTQSIKTKTDSAQCGDCLLKGILCYLNPVYLNNIWRSARGLKVSKIIPTFKKAVRFGVYGDPAFIPIKTVESIAEKSAKGFTGYTHQWHKASKKYSRFFMASVDNLMAENQKCTSKELKEKANLKGYRTYRIIKEESEILEDEILCPYTTHQTQCNECLLCNGTYKGKNRKNIAIKIHGPQNKIKTYLKTKS